jgi:hypothetical protein
MLLATGAVRSLFSIPRQGDYPMIAIQILQGLLGIVSLVCLILVLVQMFQHGQVGLGVACIVLTLCFGIGALITFIVGWVNANRWGITNIMLAWTVCIVLGFALTGVGFAIGQPLAIPGR